MNKTERLSIRITCIIPTLNRASVLLDTVRMLLAQSYPAHEIIIVDQTPKPDEETRRALTEWNQQGKIRWLWQKEPNASKARNAGALAATGDVVLFLDDDIRIKPDFIASYAETFARTGAIAVSGQVLEGNAKTVNELPPKAFDPEIGWLYFRKNYSKVCETSFMMSGNVAIRRNVFLAVSGMDENYEKGAFREESDFAMRFKRAGYVFVFQPQASIYHLGLPGAPEGGSRAFIPHKHMAGWHHCVGDWYFTLGFADCRSLPHLMRCSLRHFVVNRKHLQYPYWLPVNAALWLAAFPVALCRRARGARLIKCAQTLYARHQN